jgi:hypothetical protein
MPERVDRKALKRANHGALWRLLGAAACLVGSPCFIGKVVVEGPILQGALGAAGVLAALAGLVLIFRADRYQQPSELAAKGLTEEVAYRATRCLQLEDLGDHGPLYVVQLDSGEALYVGGQWLMDYEPFEDEEDPAEKGPRRFPCTEFILVRRKDSREVLDLHCSGTPFAPESVRQWRFDLPGLEELPESGDVLPVGMYDDLLQRLPVGRAH